MMGHQDKDCERTYRMPAEIKKNCCSAKKQKVFFYLDQSFKVCSARLCLAYSSERKVPPRAPWPAGPLLKHSSIHKGQYPSLFFFFLRKLLLLLLL